MATTGNLAPCDVPPCDNPSASLAAVPQPAGGAGGNVAGLSGSGALEGAERDPRGLPLRRRLASAAKGRTRTRRVAADRRDDPGAGGLSEELKRYPPTPESEALVVANTKLACKVAWGYYRKTGGAVAYDDLEALAYVGLVKGCRRFDPARGCKLSTIAYPFIHGEILHYFRDTAYAIRFPMRWRECWGKARAMLAEPGMNPEAVAHACGLNGVAELEEMLSAMTGTSELNDETQGRHHDPEHEIDLIEAVLPLVQQAFDNLRPCDAELIRSWWESPRRKAFPGLAITQFLARVRRLMGGIPLAEYRQGKLPLLLAITTPAATPSQPAPKRPRSRSARQLAAAAHQMGFGDLLA